MLQRVKYVTPHFFYKQKYKIKAIKVVLELFKLAKQPCTRGVQYVMKTAQYFQKFYIYTLRNYFNLKVCFLAKYM